MITVWTDGACFPNPGKGGWGWTTLTGKEDSGAVDPTTNQIMELTAAIRAIETMGLINGPVLVISDSQYVVKGATLWLPTWLGNGWRNSKGGPVANRALWEKMHGLLVKYRPQFEWVKGHSDDPGNDRADLLATTASGASAALIESCNRRYRGEEKRV